MKSAVFVIVAILTASIARAEWTTLGVPYGGRVNCIIECGTDILIGTNGQGVMRSSDNGAHWIASRSGLDNPWIYALCTSGDTVYAAGVQYVYRSLDRGLSWLYAGDNLLPYRYPSKMELFNDTLYIATEVGYLCRSGDHGMHWDTAMVYNDASAGRRTGFTFVHGSLFVAGDYVSRFDWSTKHLQLSDSGLVGWKFTDLVSSGDTVYVGGVTGLSRSFDAGRHWSAVVEIADTINALAMHNGAIYTAHNATIYCSTNAGSTWTHSTVLPGESVLGFFLRDTDAFAVTTMLGVYHHTETNDQWLRSIEGLTNTRFSGLHAWGTRLFCAALNGAPVSQSLDGGFTWTESYNGLPANIERWDHINSVLYAYPMGYGLYRSTDGGAWQHLALTNTTVNSLTTQQGILFCAMVGNSDDGVVARSRDNGASWVSINNGENRGALRVAANDRFLFCTNWTGLNLFRSSDFGNSWNELLHIQPAKYWGANGLILAEHDTVFGISGEERLVRSMDNGDSWAAPDSAFPSVVMDMVKSNDALFFACGKHGVYVKSSWNSPIHSANRSLPDSNVVAMTVSDSFLIVATKYQLFRRPIDEVLSDVESPSSYVPKNFSLNSVFPNPIVDDALIEYSVSSPGVVHFTIASMTGAVAWSAAYRHTSAGAQTISLPISSLRSGVFELRAECNGTVRSRMISVVK